MRIIAKRLISLIAAVTVLLGGTYSVHAADFNTPGGVSTIHVAAGGDTLYKLAKKYHTTVKKIKEINGLTNDVVTIGQAFVIPGNSAASNHEPIQVNAYIEPVTPSVDRKQINDAGKYLTYISPFSYQVNPDGSLNIINDRPVLEASNQQKVSGLLTITNFRNGNFDTKLVHNILTDNSVQQKLIKNILKILKAKGYYALNIDFERIPPEDRELYNGFLKKVVQVLHAQNYLVSTALAPKPFDLKVGDWHGAHDYRAQGQLVDFVVIMTYEWGWSGGRPMAVAPIQQVEEVIKYAASVMPPAKIMMGMPLYGYDWSLPYVPGGKWARRVSPQEALSLAQRYGSEIRYDQEAQAPYFYYSDQKGIKHVVWFDDARSVQAKLNLVNKYGLRGVSYWVLGMPFSQNWAILTNNFQISKISS